LLGKLPDTKEGERHVGDNQTVDKMFPEHGADVYTQRGEMVMPSKQHDMMVMRRSCRCSSIEKWSPTLKENMAKALQAARYSGH
jgi:hypothetical protein